MDRRVKEFRRETARPERQDTGRRYTESARALAVSFAQDAVARGESVAAAASALGISAQTLTYWISRSAMGSRAALVPVEVIANEGTRVERADGVVVTLPNGIVISGLDVDGAVAVLRGLR